MQIRRALKFLFLIFIVMSGRAYAQTGTSSPYSRFGVGDLQSFNHARNAGMGGLSFAIREDSVIPDFINFNNPASYTSIKLTTFDAGVMGTYASLQNSRNNETVTNASVKYFGFGFPVAKWWGGCFGLKPYSSIGYGMRDSSSVSDTTSGTDIPVQNLFSGKGGLNQFYIGSAIQPLKNLVTWYHSSKGYKKLSASASKQTLAPEIAVFKTAKKSYEAVEKSYASAEQAYESAKASYAAAKDSVTVAKKRYAAKKDSLPDAGKKLELAKAKLQAASADVEATKSKIGPAKERLDAAKDTLGVAKKVFEEAMALNDSVKIKNKEARLNDVSGLSFGVNSSFLFGTLDRERKIEYRNTAYYDFKELNSIDLGGFYFNLGAQYTFNFKNKTSLVLGAVFTPNTNIKGSQTLLAERYQKIDTQDGGYDNVKDTVKYEKSSQGTVTLPMSFGGGIAFKRNGKWQIGVDYLQQSWSKYQSFGQSDGLSDSRRIAGGGEFAPGKKKSILGGGRPVFRLGGYYSQTFLQLKGTQLNDYGVSVGFGFPVSKGWGMVNMAFELGERGTTSSNLIKEQYLNFRLGITFNDKWFNKRKYD